jgi:high-affinity Fe2+/Pb2+ permease
VALQPASILLREALEAMLVIAAIAVGGGFAMYGLHPAAIAAAE